MTSFGNMRLPELRQECRKRGAKMDGRKADLVERLEAYERNANFGHATAMEPDFSMKTPDYDTYRDINLDSSLPVFRRECFCMYLISNDAKFSKKAISLYNDRYLCFCRWAANHSTKTVFIHAKCQAQMKNSIMYTVDIEVDHDSVVIAAQCECAAGMGPSAHCKHVTSVLHGLSVYQKEGGFKTQETCTQILQRFHARKQPHGGSPVKASEIKLPFGEGVVYDPRPRKRRNMASYPSHFFNTWKAIPNVTDRPVSHLFQPVNMFAYSHDHGCYCTHSLEAQCLKDHKIIAITNTERVELEKRTQGQSCNKQWSWERTKRLQSSNFGQICKMTEKTDKNKFALSLTSVGPTLKTPAIVHGKRHEPVALSKFQCQTGKACHSCGIIACKELPFLACSPDAVVQEEDGSFSVVEVKCPYTARDQKISPSTVPYLENVEGQLKLKRGHDYFYQLQGQMLCTGSKTCYFVIYTFLDCKILTIQKDDVFIQDMTKMLHIFFESHFKSALLEVLLYRPFSDEDQSRLQCQPDVENV